MYDLHQSLVDEAENFTLQCARRSSQLEGMSNDNCRRLPQPEDDQSIQKSENPGKRTFADAFGNQDLASLGSTSANDLSASTSTHCSNGINSRGSRESNSGIGSTSEIITIDGIRLPLLNRKSEQYVAVRMVESQLLSKFPNEYPPEMNTRPLLVSQYMSDSEALLLNKTSLEKYPFTGSDLIVKLDDFQEFYFAVKKYFPQNILQSDQTIGSRPTVTDESKSIQPIDGGWVQLNDTLVPYVLRKSLRFVPKSVIVNAVNLSVSNNIGDNSSVAEVDFLNFLCTSAGIKFVFTRKTALVGLGALLADCNPPLKVIEVGKDDPFCRNSRNSESCGYSNIPTSNGVGITPYLRFDEPQGISQPRWPYSSVSTLSGSSFPSSFAAQSRFAAVPSLYQVSAPTSSWRQQAQFQYTREDSSNLFSHCLPPISDTSNLSNTVSAFQNSTTLLQDSFKRFSAEYDSRYLGAPRFPRGVSFQNEYFQQNQQASVSMGRFYNPPSNRFTEKSYQNEFLFQSRYGMKPASAPTMPQFSNGCFMEPQQIVTDRPTSRPSELLQQSYAAVGTQQTLPLSNSLPVARKEPAKKRSNAKPKASSQRGRKVARSRESPQQYASNVRLTEPALTSALDSNCARSSAMSPIDDRVVTRQKNKALDSASKGIAGTSIIADSSSTSEVLPSQALRVGNEFDAIKKKKVPTATLR